MGRSHMHLRLPAAASVRCAPLPHAIRSRRRRRWSLPPLWRCSLLSALRCCRMASWFLRWSSCSACSGHSRTCPNTKSSPFHITLPGLAAWRQLPLTS